eukprot:9474312-Pyramimonas_sp.AAC.2
MPRGALSSNLPKGPKACLTGFGPRLRSRDSHTTAPGGLMKPPDSLTSRLLITTGQVHAGAGCARGGGLAHVLPGGAAMWRRAIG